MLDANEVWAEANTVRDAILVVPVSLRGTLQFARRISPALQGNNYVTVQCEQIRASVPHHFVRRQLAQEKVLY